MRRFFVAVGLVLALEPAIHAQPFLPGDLAVVRFDNGGLALANTSCTTFIDEYTPAGVLVRSINVSSLATFSNSGTATSEGQISLSTDGRFLVFAGYNAAPGSATSIVASTAAATNRMVGLMDASATLTTTLLGGTAFSAGNPRSAASTNGTDIWVAGSVSGVNYTAFGSATATQLSTAPTNNRVVNIAGGQLYASSSSGAFQGPSTVGTGLPTTSGQTTTLLPGFPTAAGPSNYDYVFLNPTTLYVADDRTAAGGGIEKWTFAAGTWTLQYSSLDGTAGLRSLTLSSDGLTLFGITTSNLLVSAVDNGPVLASFTFTTLATAPTNDAFRGVEFAPTAVPEPGSMALAGFAVVGFGTRLIRRKKAAV
jgi:hypothetical protein